MRGMGANLGIVVCRGEQSVPILLHPDFEVKLEQVGVEVEVIHPADHQVEVLSMRLHKELAIRPAVQ